LIQSKNKQLRDDNELIAGYQEMFFDEVSQSNRAKKGAATDLANLKDKLASTHFKYIEHKLLSAKLQDEVRDSDLLVSELKVQVSDLSSIVDSLYDELDCQCDDFDSIVNYIHKYYAEEMAKLKLIAKHYVPNKDGKGKTSNIFQWH
jgi:chromosome segregation ATPase